MKKVMGKIRMEVKCAYCGCKAYQEVDMNKNHG